MIFDPEKREEGRPKGMLKKIIKGDLRQNNIFATLVFNHVI